MAPARPPEIAPIEVVRQHFPRISTAIELMWGSQELETYLGKLVISDRDDRQGFPPAVLDALLCLSRDHAQRFNFCGEDGEAGADPYSRNGFRKR